MRADCANRLPVVGVRMSEFFKASELPTLLLELTLVLGQRMFEERARLAELRRELGPKLVPSEGAALLASKDVVPVMDAHERSISAGGGGMEPPANVNVDLEEKVRSNTKLMTALGGDSVPFLVFKNPAGGKPETFAGALPTAQLKQLLGL